MILNAQIGVVKDAIEEMEQVHTHTHTPTASPQYVLSVSLIVLILGFSRSRGPVQRRSGTPGRGGASQQPGHVLVRGGQACDWSVPGPDESLCGVSEEAGVSSEKQR